MSFSNKLNNEMAAAIISLPVKSGPSAIPVLLIRETDSVRICKEALEFSWLLLLSGRSYNDVRSLNATLKRVVELYAYKGRPVLDEDGMLGFMWEYLDIRLNGNISGKKGYIFGRPVKWPTLKNDIRHISNYSEWCSKNYGSIELFPKNPIPLSSGKGSVKKIISLREKTKRQFLGHLSKHRRRTVSDDSIYTVPIRNRPNKRKGFSPEVMSHGFIQDLIGAEKNFVYKMIWILGAFGGPRISEQLNMWVCDVLPGTARSRLFPGDRLSSIPLGILSDPIESTYCGSFGDRSKSRQQYLIDNYGLRPRPALSGNDPLFCGWKGMLYTEASRLISQVHWSDFGAARMWFKLASKLINFHASYNVSTSHPYLLVNTDPRKPEFLGKPMKISNIEKAFERACQRIGVKAHICGRNIHGLRHYYKTTISQDLGLSRDLIKIMMHHTTDGAQDHYGTLLNERLSSQIENAVNKRQILGEVS